MKVTEIRYKKTVQEARFEPLDLEVTATLEEGDTVKQVMDELREVVDGQIKLWLQA